MSASLLYLSYTLTILDPETFADDLADIVEMLSGIAAQWSDIALALRLKTGNMEIIDRNYSRDARRCLALAITEWLQLKYNHKRNGMPSWKKLAKAVRGIDNALYLRIIEEHPREN